MTLPKEFFRRLKLSMFQIFKDGGEFPDQESTYKHGYEQGWLSARKYYLNRRTGDDNE